MADVRRRAVLGAMLGALGGVAGCAGVARTVGLGDSVRVAVSWSSTELAAFAAVMAGWAGHGYELIPFGDDIDAALGARTAGRMDVVALPRLGLVADNVDRLERLPDEVWRPEYERIWGQGQLGGRYALPFKLAHKSVVWYRRAVLDELGLQPPQSWEDWLTLNDAIIARGRVAPLALGGADGWMLTGFFENVLLRNDPGTYDALAARSRDPRLWLSAGVRAALAMLADMWGRPGTFAGGVNRALLQQFPDAVLEVFRFHRAAMVVAPDFAESVIRRVGVPDRDVATFTFPARAGSTGPEAALPWIRDTGGFLAANPAVGGQAYSPILRRLSTELLSDVRFDLADQLGAVGGRDGLQLVLVHLLRSLDDGTPRDEAVRAAARAMVDIDTEAG
jgi:alpha-glucoside transport system substrate-binding protein